MAEYGRSPTLAPAYSRTLDLARLRISALMGWISVVLVQALWFYTGSEDLIAALLVISGGILGIGVFLRRELLTGYPISTLMMLGYVSCYFILPPLATLLEAKPLTYNLDHPVLTFVHPFVCLFILAGAHQIYRRWDVLQGVRWWIVNRIYKPAGLFRAPSNIHLLLMGFVGVAAMAYHLFVVQNVLYGFMDPTNKFIQGFYPLSLLPYLMFLRQKQPGREKIHKNAILILAAHTGIMVVLAMARNSRTVMFEGLASIGLAYAYLSVVGLRSITRKAFGKWILVVLVGILSLNALSDLATSMVIVRNKRQHVPPWALISETLETFSNKEAIKSFRAADKSWGAFYQEEYVDNVLLARVANMKYVDIAVDCSLRIGAGMKSWMRNVEFQRVLAVFPRPLIKLFHLPVDKDFVGRFSGGDLLLYVGSGYSPVLGWFITGSIFGSGYALYGWWYPVLLGAVAVVLFCLADAMTARTTLNGNAGVRQAWVPHLAPMAVISFYEWFVFFTSAAKGNESFSSLFSYILRGWIQYALIYALAFWGTLWITRMFGPRRRL